MPNLEAVMDKLAIRELYGRMAVASAKRDADGWMGCWTDDALWQTPHFEHTGKDALRAQWDLIWKDFSNVAVFYEVGACEIAGDSARATCCVFEVITLASGSILNMAGLYEDEMKRQGGDWAFSHRWYSTLSTAPIG